MLQANEDRKRLVNTEHGLCGLELLGGGRIFTERELTQVSRTDVRL